MCSSKEFSPQGLSVCELLGVLMGRMLTPIIHSLQIRSPSLPVFSDSEGHVAALDVEAKPLTTGSAEEGQDGHGGDDGQLADYIQVGCCPLGEQSGLPGVIHLPDTSPSWELVFSNILSAPDRQDGSVFTPSSPWQAASHPSLSAALAFSHEMASALPPSLLLIIRDPKECGDWIKASG